MTVVLGLSMGGGGQPATPTRQAMTSERRIIPPAGGGSMQHASPSLKSGSGVANLRCQPSWHLLRRKLPGAPCTSAHFRLHTCVLCALFFALQQGALARRAPAIFAALAAFS